MLNPQSAAEQSLAPRLAIATFIDAAELNEDDRAAAQRLRASGLNIAPAPWNDERIDWGQFDAVLIRSTWDYHTAYDGFLAWLDRLDRLGVPTINPTRVLRWNSDKRYLLELAAQGVDIVPTRLASRAELETTLKAFAQQQVVVKPAVSASAWCTVRGRAHELRESLSALPPHLDYLVQPFVPEVASEGEWSLLFFGGSYSHAVLKKPAAGDYRVQREFGGVSEPLDPGASVVNAASAAIAAVEALGFERPVYARIDGVRRGDRFLIMELELIEPFLFLESDAEASHRFAEAVLSHLRARALDI